MKFTITDARINTFPVEKLTTIQKWVCKWFKITPQVYFTHTIWFISSVTLYPSEILLFENGLSFVVTSVSKELVVAKTMSPTTKEDINVNEVVISRVSHYYRSLFGSV